jgi:hypothetical protein
MIVHVNVGRGNVDRHSLITGQICEISAPTGEALDYPFIGGAKMTINNICPRDDGIVDFWVSVYWDSDLNFKLWFLVSND